MNRRRAGKACSMLLSVGFFLAGSCTYPRTQVVVEIRADNRIRELASEVLITVRDAQQRLLLSRRVFPQSTDFSGFPVRVAVSARDERKRYEIEIEAIQQRRNGNDVVSTTLARNRARSAFSTGRVLYYSLWLLSDCNCAATTERCAPGPTFESASRCLPIEIDPTDLVDPLDVGVSTGGDATADASGCIATQRLCNGVCASCPPALTTSCRDTSCVVETCSTGLTSNQDRTACVNVTPYIPFELRTTPRYLRGLPQANGLSSVALSYDGLTLAQHTTYRTGVRFLRRATRVEPFGAPSAFLQPDAETPYFGSGIAMTEELTIIGRPSGQGAATVGEVFVYRSGNAVPPQNPVQVIAGSTAGFGSHVAVDRAGVWLAVGDYGVGVRVYRRATGLTFETTPRQTIAPPALSGEAFGGSVAVNADATLLAVGDWSAGPFGQGRISFFSRSSGNEMFGNAAQLLDAPQRVTDFSLVGMTENGLVLVANARMNSQSVLLVYERARADLPFLEPQQIISSPDPQELSIFGSGASISSDGRELFIVDGVYRVDATSSGVVWMFSRTLP